MSEGDDVGVALAGKIWRVKANKNIIIIAIHQEGKLLLKMANIELDLSHIEPLLLATNVPNNIPMIIANIVDELKSSNVFGSFSSIMSLTLDDPESVVKKCDFPKFSVIMLTNLENSFVGEYHSSSRPRVLVLRSISLFTNFCFSAGSWNLRCLSFTSSTT
jgi:hypothetical protein